MFGAATYTYDALDNLTRVTLTGGANVRDHSYHYDNQNRLTGIGLHDCDTGGSQGNLIFADRLQGGCNGTSLIVFDYDERGNLSHHNSITFDFDHGNRLREVSGIGTPTSRYQYDGHGRRVSDSINGGARYSYYTHDGRLTYATDDRRGVLSLYLYLGSSLVAIREQDGDNNITVKYQHTDALGSPVVITDENRTVLERRDWEPYGLQLQPAPDDGPGYTGHLFDDVTGLNYMQQRYYDPGIGRFISTDPVLPSPSTGANFNRYWYANNNPYRYVDPDGRYGRGAGRRLSR